MKFFSYLFTLTLAAVTAAGLTGCTDDLWVESDSPAVIVEEGIPGELELCLSSNDFDKQKVSRGTVAVPTEQHVHSAYIFIVDLQKEKLGYKHCPIISRRYFTDLTPQLSEVTEEGENYFVNTLHMPAVSCQKVQIFSIVNVGFSDVQGIQNDSELLLHCDTISTLEDLFHMKAMLEHQEGEQSDRPEVNVERMQGHHLMSGFFSTLGHHHYASGSNELLTLQAQNGKIVVRDFRDGRLFRPVGIPGEGEAAGLFVHRLDSKITFNIEPDGALKDTPGAYFKLTSWKVKNAPLQEYLYWEKAEKRQPLNSFGESKTFKRDITPTPTGGWTFTFYQFENYNTDKFNQQRKFKEIGSGIIADQYNQQYNLQGNNKVRWDDIEGSFFSENSEQSVYPNKYTDFAYSLREQEHKQVLPGGPDHAPGDMYEPNLPGNPDQDIIVQNVGFEFAPQNASYIELTGIYYNPAEPVRRRHDTDPNPQISFEEFPYLNTAQQPVRTIGEAAKRTRYAMVLYRIHLGYVGGGNYMMNNDGTSQHIQDFADFKKKLNDYNVLRNHHYIYTLKIAGVQNIKLEATRENGGNILEQEKQPGAEGVIVESQHFFELDAHYETRNVTIDFARMPEDYDEGFSFSLVTPYETYHGTLKKKPNGEVGIFDRNGTEQTTIRGHDLDWIHFAWHGTRDNPSRSLINPDNLNGIPYSQTYGGYEEQQSYLDPNRRLVQKQDEKHPYRLINALEFSHLVWTYFCKWKEYGKPKELQTITFTIYVDEFYYDFNPVTRAQVNWTSFTNKPRRKAIFFMEREEGSADQHSWYADAHLALYQSSIQTLYATEAKGGQTVADVAFGMEGLDEFKAKYRCFGVNYPKEPERQNNGHNFKGTSLTNGLFNNMQWYSQTKGDPKTGVIPWDLAESYFHEKARMYIPNEKNYTQNDDTYGRNARRGQWAVYSRNRDLNRNNQLEPFEIHWFVPAIDQYTLCFLGGRPVFENPLFEREKTITITSGTFIKDWAQRIPLMHFMGSTNKFKNQIFWAEEGCSKGFYGAANLHVTYGIRMMRMLTRHGRDNTGAAFEGSLKEENLQQDPLYIVTQKRNGAPVPYNERTDGRNYYIVLNKMNPNAFREYIAVGEIGRHTHEQKQNWLYREYVIAKNKIGYTSYTNAKTYDRRFKIDGVPRTWWQVNGVWTEKTTCPGGENGNYFYQDAEHSLAYDYFEDPTGNDRHHWRMPNLREAAIMSMSFPEAWFGKNMHGYGAIASGTKSDNLGPSSTNIPYWDIRCNMIVRILKDEKGIPNSRDAIYFWVRSVRDVR